VPVVVMIMILVLVKVIKIETLEFGGVISIAVVLITIKLVEPIKNGPLKINELHEQLKNNYLRKPSSPS
jgi:uncharacterized membrane protein (DUF441 family)